MKLSCAAIVFICTLLGVQSGVSLADDEVYKYEEYVVQRGDTQWDIAIEKLENPFLWPKVWQVNPEIENADLIYPGQIIRIPVDLLKPELRPVTGSLPAPAPPMEEPEEIEMPVEEPPEEEVEASATSVPPIEGETVEAVRGRFLASPEIIAAAGMVTDSMPNAGRILGSHTEHVLFGKGDEVYIMAPGAVVGQKFSVYQEIKRISHPASGRSVGTLYEILGSVEIIRIEGGGTVATVTSSFSAVQNGALLAEYFDEQPPIVSETPSKPDIRGYVVATKELKSAVGDYDIVYLDRGEKDGVSTGDLFSIIRSTADNRELAGINIEREISRIQVIRTLPKTATALILKSIQEGRRGDRFGNLDTN